MSSLLLVMEVLKVPVRVRFKLCLNVTCGSTFMCTKFAVCHACEKKRDVSGREVDMCLKTFNGSPLTPK